MLLVDNPADYLSREQIEQLVKAINPLRVSKDGKGFSHVQAYEIRAHLTRIFGFGRWSEEQVNVSLAFEDRDKDRWTVCYLMTKRLTVCAPSGLRLAVYENTATGDAPNQKARADAHDMAVKTADSQALKRCAISLGDQFGLSLYNAGSLKPLVGRTLVMPDTPEKPDEDEQDGDVSDHVTSLAPETPAPQPEPETSTPPAEAPADTAAARAPTADELRDKALAIPDGKRPRAYLTQLLAEAHKHKVHGQMVADGNGEAMTFEALISRLIQQHGRAA